jgi:quercetin dioxygenase-like cupin family protein
MIMTALLAPTSKHTDLLSHEILKSIPHQRVISNNDDSEEIFDLYKLGLFNATGSIVNSSINAQEIVELVELQPNAIYKPHYHKKSAAIIYIILGTGRFQLGQDFIQYHPGIRVVIHAGILHGFQTKDRTLFLSIQSPPILNYKSGAKDLHYGE